MNQIFNYVVFSCCTFALFSFSSYLSYPVSYEHQSILLRLYSNYNFDFSCIIMINSVRLVSVTYEMHSQRHNKVWIVSSIVRKHLFDLYHIICTYTAIHRPNLKHDSPTDEHVRRWPNSHVLGMSEHDPPPAICSLYVLFDLLIHLPNNYTLMAPIPFC